METSAYLGLSVTPSALSSMTHDSTTPAAEDWQKLLNDAGLGPDDDDESLPSSDNAAAWWGVGTHDSHYPIVSGVTPTSAPAAYPHVASLVAAMASDSVPLQAVSPPQMNAHAFRQQPQHLQTPSYHHVYAPHSPHQFQQHPSPYFPSVSYGGAMQHQLGGYTIPHAHRAPPAMPSFGYQNVPKRERTNDIETSACAVDCTSTSSMSASSPVYAPLSLSAAVQAAFSTENLYPESLYSLPQHIHPQSQSSYAAPYNMAHHPYATTGRPLPHQAQPLYAQNLHHHASPAPASKRPKLEHSPSAATELLINSSACTSSMFTSSSQPASASKPMPSKPVHPAVEMTSSHMPRGMKRGHDSIENTLRNLGSDGQLSFHVYDNSQRLYVRYRQGEEWKLKDIGDIADVMFHNGVPMSASPLPLASHSSIYSATSDLLDDSFAYSSPSADVLLPDLFGGAHSLALPPHIDMKSLTDEEIPGSTSRPSSSINSRPTDNQSALPMGLGVKRELAIEFKRKEHYWRRGIWIRINVKVLTPEGAAVRDAAGSIALSLLSVKGETVKRACEKCSKYYFRYKNVECDGQAPAFEVEEQDRSLQIRNGHASFNIRVWECSHHFLSPHTLVFSWIDPEYGGVRAMCAREIVISSGSGQERKLKDMQIAPQDALVQYLEALMFMEEGSYPRAIEALRCLRWKSYHFLGNVMIPYDEKLGDCYMRMSDHKNAADYYNRAARQIIVNKLRLTDSLRYYMLAVLYIKMASLEHLRLSETGAVSMESEYLSKMMAKAASAYNKASLDNSAHQDVVSSPSSCSSPPSAQSPRAGEEMAYYRSAQREKESEGQVLRQYYIYVYNIAMAGLLLKLKVANAQTSIDNPLSCLHIARIAMEALLSPHDPTIPSASLNSSHIVTLLSPLRNKLHIGPDGMRKLLAPAMITDNAITVLSSEFGVTNETLQSIVNELQEAVDMTAKLHTKGHRSLSISRCTYVYASLVAGRASFEEASRSIDLEARAVDKFWKAGSANMPAGRFECRQLATLAENIRNAMPTSTTTPTTASPDLATNETLAKSLEHSQMYRLWLHSPLDAISWHYVLRSLCPDTFPFSLGLSLLP